MADFSITPANVLTGSVQGTVGIADEAIDAGELVYKKANGKYGLAEAGATVLQATVAGMAANSCVANQPFLFVGGGTITVGSAFTSKGKTVVLSATPGKLAPDADISTTDDFKSLVGFSNSATAIAMNVQNTGIQMP